MKKQKKSMAAKNNKKVEKIEKKVVVEASSPAVSKGPKIMPIGDRVLVRPFLTSETEKKNDFGIIIPDTISKERSEQGEILAVGEGRYENGKLVPMRLKVGDRVIFSKYAFDEVKNGDEELFLLKEENILAIIRK